MIKYKCICPYCQQEARVSERTSLVMDTELLGFNHCERLGFNPEFSLEEEFDEDQADCFLFRM